MKEKIWLSSPHMGGKEQKFVQEAFDTNWVAPLGPNVDGFEEDLEVFLGEGVHVAALSSGTAALHLGLILLGVQPSDEVLCQGMTFSASANAICYVGATPIFIDSEEETWNMSPQFLEEAIIERMRNHKKPKAIIVVHLYGMPAKMDAISTVAAKYEIPILEDAAEALGSTINGRKCGTFGDIGILSFNGNKIITTSGGGALISRHVHIVQKAKFLATQARDPAPHYQHSSIGYNYRMSNICAGIGRGQMMVIDERVAQRRSNFKFYEHSLSKINGFSMLIEPNGYFSNRWLTTLLVDPAFSPNEITREDIRLAMEKENIESRPLWKPMHMQPVFAKTSFFGDNTSDGLFEKGLCLPSGSNLTEEDLSRIAQIVENVLMAIA
jgi:dTDP-4-amino-4,6-dideoxygalactose transaminase